MREQIVVEIPTYLGTMIAGGAVKTITIKKGHKDITIKIVRDSKDLTNELSIETGLIK